jgi:hypothetical protein
MSRIGLAVLLATLSLTAAAAERLKIMHRVPQEFEGVTLRSWAVMSSRAMCQRAS